MKNQPQPDTCSRTGTIQIENSGCKEETREHSWELKVTYTVGRERKGTLGEVVSHGPGETDMTDNKGLHPDDSQELSWRAASDRKTFLYVFKENHAGSRRDNFGKGKVRGQRDKTLKLLQKCTTKW